MKPCCGVGHSGGGPTQLRSLQFLPESIVRFMRRGVRSAVACHALPARDASPGRELTGDGSAPAEVNLVRCLAHAAWGIRPLCSVT